MQICFRQQLHVLEFAEKGEAVLRSLREESGICVDYLAERAVMATAGAIQYIKYHRLGEGGICTWSSHT